MYATLSTIVRPTPAKRSGSFTRLLSICCDGIAGYFVRRAAIASLSEADDRALRDIGIARSQIEAAVDGSFTLSDPARMS